ncbi:uncharacterized protein [Montipora foliosa]|uniref:uncharacterized protein n=1 Tax=Montipora foliosa TaxID=591990 RepID=UPI0035F18033
MANSLVGVLLRFRQGSVGLAADVEAMFHQVRVQKEDQDALRFLRTASYNAKGFSPEVPAIVERNFYVDNALLSFSDGESAIKAASNLVEILGRGGFRLTKFMSNSNDVMSTIPVERRKLPDLTSVFTWMSYRLKGPWSPLAQNAPVKFTSIPRLELQAAVLATRLNRMLREEIDLCIQDTKYWTDSEIVLHYLKNEKRRFQTYVANRVHEIRGNSNPDEWNHVPGSLNPEHDVSRGLNPSELSLNDRWKTVRTARLILEDYDAAATAIVRIIQQSSYPQEVKDLNTRGEVKSSSSIVSINPVLDDHGILRVKGHVVHPPVANAAGNQKILPRDHPITAMMVRHTHESIGHLGRKHLISKVREKLWILQIRVLTRSILGRFFTVHDESKKLSMPRGCDVKKSGN